MQKQSICFQSVYLYGCILKIETQPFLQRTTFTVNTVKYCWRQKATVRIICVQFGGMSQPMVFKVVNQCHSHVINLVLVFSVHAPLPLYLAVTVFMSSLCYPSLSLSSSLFLFRLLVLQHCLTLLFKSG